MTDSPVVLAASMTGPAVGLLLAVGLVVVAVLIGAFVYGSRRKSREGPPVHPGTTPGPGPASGSWQTPGSGSDPGVRGGGPAEPTANGRDNPGPPY
ncbi:DUF6479 family protein [Kitasatospora sp. NPDC057223]|uniref:DUF6479 family protein n=1 Tax=Kitasatospora sp. NPDC057223 TaxID=3346055 RepID=UPI0036288353